jgi:hypothetical protein
VLLIDNSGSVLDALCFFLRGRHQPDRDKSERPLREPSSRKFLYYVHNKCSTSNSVPRSSPSSISYTVHLA